MLASRWQNFRKEVEILVFKHIITLVLPSQGNAIYSSATAAVPTSTISTIADENDARAVQRWTSVSACGSATLDEEITDVELSHFLFLFCIHV